MKASTNSVRPKHLHTENNTATALLLCNFRALVPTHRAIAST